MYNTDHEMKALASYVRLPTIEDKENLPVYSHSRLECFENCSYRNIMSLHL